MAHNSKTSKFIESDCSICLQPYLQPCELKCEHIFCFLCIKGFLNQKLEYQKTIFSKYTRSTDLAQLYSECLAQEPKYIPKGFRETNANMYSKPIGAEIQSRDCSPKHPCD